MQWVAFSVHPLSIQMDLPIHKLEPLTAGSYPQDIPVQSGFSVVPQISLMITAAVLAAIFSATLNLLTKWHIFPIFVFCFLLFLSVDLNKSRNTM